MFVGDTGISRVIRRTLEMMKELDTEDPALLRRHGVVDLPLVQRYVNFWFSSSLDLFGAERSSNAATYFATGLKGRPDEGTYEDHICKDTSVTLQVPAAGGGIEDEAVPTRNAMNEIVRQSYVKDCGIGLSRWNRLIKKAGVDFEIRLPSSRFRRSIGPWAGVPTDPGGQRIDAEAFHRNIGDWLPSEADRAYVRSLMQQVTEPGKMAAWIAPPDRGINSMPVEYEYVKLH